MSDQYGNIQRRTGYSERLISKQSFNYILSLYHCDSAVAMWSCSCGPSTSLTETSEARRNGQNVIVGKESVTVVGSVWKQR